MLMLFLAWLPTCPPLSERRATRQKTKPRLAMPRDAAENAAGSLGNVVRVQLLIHLHLQRVPNFHGHQQLIQDCPQNFWDTPENTKLQAGLFTPLHVAVHGDNAQILCMWPLCGAATFSNSHSLYQKHPLGILEAHLKLWVVGKVVQFSGAV